MSSYVPDEHTQPDATVLPTSNTALEGQLQHVATVLAFISELNCPAGHVYAVHAEIPESLLCVPARHAVHDVKDVY